MRTSVKSPRNLLLLTACLLAPLTSRADIRVLDYENTPIELAKPAQRIVALTPHAVENLYSVGLGNRIVATVEYANFPERAKRIPRIGSFASVSIELITQKKPDLIVAWGSGSQRSAIERLRELGYPVYVDEPRSLDDIARSLRDMAILGGTENQGQAAAARLEAAQRAYQKKYAKVKKLAVFYEIWNDPLQTINGSHLISQIIHLCGGVNIFASEKMLAPMVSIEAVLERDPDIIITSGNGNESPLWLKSWTRFHDLRATESKALYAVPGDDLQRPTLRILNGLREVCTDLDDARHTSQKASF